MALFSLIVKGLYFGSFIFLVVVFGNIFFPGVLSDTALTTLGIVIIFSEGIIDMIFTFGSTEES